MSESGRKTCVEIADSVRNGRCTALETVEETLRTIARVDGELNAFRETFDEDARAQARLIDEKIARGEDPGPLAGVPIGIKDNIATTEGTTACGSRMLENYRSPFDATVVERLREAGAIPIGHTNCDEFAMGSSTENCAFGAVRNPWDTTRVPGGSSGGSAAAVGGGLVPAALGSDTGGSIRQPASFCGCVGLKPSYGRVSRYGLVAFGSSLDQVGPFTRTVEDAALILEVIGGQDRRDSTSADEPIDDIHGESGSMEGMRVGLPRQYRATGANEPEVDGCLEHVVERITAAGAEVVDIDLPMTDTSISTYYVIAPAEASSNLARYDGIRYGHRAKDDGSGLEELYARTRAEGFGPEVQRRIMLGTYVLSSGYYDAYYKRALQVRRLIKEEFDRAFESCDILLGPTSPFTAFPLGGKPDPMSMYLCDVYTVSTNIAGICGISIPAGFDAPDEHGRRRPIGIHLQAPAFAEATLFKASMAIEGLLAFDDSIPG
ncbi:MAG: Asp-tRNA(Asn)/Glu-tRNA(Gln) amidotransferase subunit GatA [Phycisphaerales bacterium]|nr:Asp-tRNA(Asn)/Glu-tRNA(Gln) amidotransferase subunit GatA [Phycisphaerales bacterium]